MGAFSIFGRRKKIQTAEIPHKIREHFFYRIHSGEYKYTQNSPENAMLVLFNRENRAVLCPVHGKWERCGMRDKRLFSSCGGEISGFLLDFSPSRLPSPPAKILFDFNLKKEVSIPPSDSEIEKFRYEHWDEINADVADEKGISRDLVYIRVVENITLNQIHTELVFLDRIRTQNFKKCLPSKLFKNAIRFEFSFDIKKNGWCYERYAGRRKVL